MIKMRMIWSSRRMGRVRALMIRNKSAKIVRKNHSTNTIIMLLIIATMISMLKIRKKKTKTPTRRPTPSSSSSLFKAKMLRTATV